VSARRAARASSGSAAGYRIPLASRRALLRLTGPGFHASPHCRGNAARQQQLTPPFSRSSERRGVQCPGRWLRTTSGRSTASVLARARSPERCSSRCRRVGPGGRSGDAEADHDTEDEQHRLRALANLTAELYARPNTRHRLAKIEERRAATRVPRKPRRSRDRRSRGRGRRRRHPYDGGVGRNLIRVARAEVLRRIASVPVPQPRSSTRSPTPISATSNRRCLNLASHVVERISGS
jgi:hypothetical protein